MSEVEPVSQDVLFLRLKDICENILKEYSSLEEFIRREQDNIEKQYSKEHVDALKKQVSKAQIELENVYITLVPNYRSK